MISLSIRQIGSINDRLVLFVAGYDGYVSGYEVNTTVGGECKRISHDLLFNMSLSSNHEAQPANNAPQKQNGKCVCVFRKRR